MHTVTILATLALTAADNAPSGAASVSVVGSLPAALAGSGESLLGIYERANASSPWSVVESGELNGRQVYGNSFVNASAKTRSGPWYMWYIEAQELPAPEGEKGLKLPAFWTIGPKHELGQLGGRLRVASDALVPEDTPSSGWHVWHGNASKWLPAPDVKIVADADAWLEQSLPVGKTLNAWRKEVDESSAGECDLQTLRRCSPEETKFITSYGMVMSKFDEDEFPEKMKAIFAALAKVPQTPQMVARIDILKQLEATIVDARARQADFFERANRVAALAKSGARQDEIQEAAGMKQELEALKVMEATNKEKAKGAKEMKEKMKEMETKAKEARDAAHAAAAKEETKEELR